MSVFTAVVLLLGTLFGVHLIWWRIALPRRQRAVLLGFFLIGGLVLAPLVGLLLGRLGVEPLSVVQWLNVGLAVVASAWWCRIKRGTSFRWIVSVASCRSAVCRR